MTRRAARRAPTTGRWRMLAAGLTLAGVASVLVGVASASPSTDVPAADAPVHHGGVTPTDDPAATPADDPAAATPAERPVRPLMLGIPALEINTPLLLLGQHDDGQVEVPEDPDRAGWFDLGPVPGNLGSSVILGHVDSVEGPAVFYELPLLRRGQRINVSRDDGTVAVFAVHSVKTYANEDFPAQEVYGSQDRREINLVTCGGAYDAARGGYQANVVVNARLLRTRDAD